MKRIISARPVAVLEDPNQLARTGKIRCTRDPATRRALGHGARWEQNLKETRFIERPAWIIPIHDSFGSLSVQFLFRPAARSYLDFLQPSFLLFVQPPIYRYIRVYLLSRVQNNRLEPWKKPAAEESSARRSPISNSVSSTPYDYSCI